jgi:predicted ATPase
MDTFELTPLFGRASDLSDIQGHLDAGVRLLTLTGSPGAGKTRLARAVLRTRCGGDEHFLDIRAASTADDVMVGVARALGAPLGDQLEAVQTAELLRRHLADAGRLLIVLDNAEHLTGPVRNLVADWLDVAPNLVVLVTSREVLDDPAETVHRVGPLRLPSHPAPDPLAADPLSALVFDDALHAPAVQLFMRCATNLGVKMPTSGPGLADVVALVTRLEGNPLAIELAAARTPLLSARAMLARLDRRFDLLNQAAPGRTSLREAIDASWQLLSAPEQRALMQLALFRGGASVEPLEALMDADPAYDGVPGLDVLAGLLRKSLVTSAPCRVLATVRRVDLYESIREFAMERLAETPALAADLSARHVGWCLETFASLDRRQFGHEKTAVHKECESELTNMLSGLALATTPHADARWSAAAARALVTGHRLLLRLVPVDHLERMIAKAAAQAEGLEPEVHVRLLATHANHLGLLNRLEPAIAAIEQSIAVASGSLELQGLAFKGFSGIATYLDADRLIGYMERALELLVAPRWRADAAYARAALGFGYARKRQFERSDVLFAAAIADLNEPADVSALAWALNNWGSALVLRGRWDDAQQVLQRAVQMGRDSHHRLVEAAALCGLGECKMAAGHHAAAHGLFTTCLASARAAGYRRHASVAAAWLGAIAHLDGDPAAAIRRYDEALPMLGVEWDAMVARGLIGSARALALAHLGEHDAATAGFEEAETVLRAMGESSLLAAHAIHRLAAAVLLGRKPPADAVAEATEIADRARSQASAMRLSHVEHAMTLLMGAVPPGASAESGISARLAIGPDTGFMALDDGTRLDLRRSPKTRRLVALLVARRYASPGVSVNVHDLFDAAWPDDRTREPHRSNRVYVAFTRLRNAGFGEVIMHDGDGYLIDPRCAVVEAEFPL